MSTEDIQAISTEVLERCALKDGKLTLADKDFAAFGDRIAKASDKKMWGTAMIALSNRLRGVPGAGAAAERILALAAIALGDKELTALVSRESARK